MRTSGSVAALFNDSRPRGLLIYPPPGQQENACPRNSGSLFPIAALLFAVGIPLSGRPPIPTRSRARRSRPASGSPTGRPVPGGSSRASQRRGSGAPALRAPAPAAPPVHGVPLLGRAPQTLGVNFLGANLADTNTYPPDTMGAAGPSQFLVGVNSRLRTLRQGHGRRRRRPERRPGRLLRSGAQRTSRRASPACATTASPGAGSSPPSTFSDTLSNNRVLVAVSSSATISIGTIWTFYFFEHDLDPPSGDTNLFLDYPTLGVDANGLVIGGNLFDTTGVYQGTTVHVVRKSQVLSGAGGDLVVGGQRRRVPQPDRHARRPRALLAPGRRQPLRRGARRSPGSIGVNNELPVTNELVLRKVTFSAPGRVAAVVDLREPRARPSPRPRCR